MADEVTYTINKKGASMDYREHNSTYSMFMLLVKWGIILNIALLAALSIGFFTPLGVFGGFVSFFAIPVGAKLILK